MNKVWVFILFLSILSLTIVRPANVLETFAVASNKSLSLTFELIAIYAIWFGVFGIIENTKINKGLSKMMSPLINLIFGKNTLNEETKKYVSLNMSANILGMGGAATPMGIKAIESMYKGSDKATYGMVMLVVLSCTGLQVIPTTVMGMMTNAGSQSPESIILPTLIASILSTILGIILVKILGARRAKS